METYDNNYEGFSLSRVFLRMCDDFGQFDDIDDATLLACLPLAMGVEGGGGNSTGNEYIVYQTNDEPVKPNHELIVYQTHEQQQPQQQLPVKPNHEYIVYQTNEQHPVQQQQQQQQIKPLMYQTNMVAPPKVMYQTNMVAPPKVMYQTNMVAPPKVMYQTNIVAPPKVTYQTNMVAPPKVTYQTNMVAPPKVTYQTNMVAPPKITYQTSVPGPRKIMYNTNVTAPGNVMYHTNMMAPPKPGPVLTPLKSSVVIQEIVEEPPAIPASLGPKLPVPEEFPFPFTPYDIQTGFMKELFRTIDEGKIGIFESPTGTGKSLSVICGALTWLRNHEAQQKEEVEAILEGRTANTDSNEAQAQANTSNNNKNSSNNKSGLDWIAEFAIKKEADEKAKKAKEELDQRLKREAKLQELRNNLRPVYKGKRKRDTLENQFYELFKDASKELRESISSEIGEGENQGGVNGEDDDAHIVVEEYLSEDESNKEKDDSEDEETEEHVTKIYFCSRTHSQLSQFVREVQKSPFGEDTRVVSLGSRQNLCINESVKKLRSLSLINDRCTELQKNKSATKKVEGESVQKRKKTSGGCPFYKQEQILDYRDRALVEVKDIEQLVSVGRQMKACPYYGTRYAIPAAQLVALPYNTLLHKSTREACGIKLKNNIIIIDEAHNLLETINNIYSVEVTGAQLTYAQSQLSQYQEKYKNRLKAKNLMYIKQIIFILSSLIKLLGGKVGGKVKDQQQSKAGSETKLFTLNDFLFTSQLDNLNLFKVLKYIERSQICRKLHGFVEKYQPGTVNPVPVAVRDENRRSGVSKFLQEIKEQKNQQEENASVKTEAEEAEENSAIMSSPLMHISGFLEALTNMDRDGRVVVNKQDLLSRSSLKFLLLNPAIHFSTVVKEARAVIVAGGTMQPISEFKEQLFIAAGVAPERILEYSCGHVIPPKNLLPVCLARGPSGQELDFTYQCRDTPNMLDELGRVLCNVCTVVPGGVVCFFPSYDYEKTVYNHWEKTGFLNRILAKKRVFREPKRAGQVDQILQEYSSVIKRCQVNGGVPAPGQLNGALLMSVVGGKMSEGINFSDELGRCVVMVGLPYPNMHSPELKEKMTYLNNTHPRSPEGKLPGQVYYENLCFKAVNQSIGRAIRHKEDYSCVLMLDQRYLRPTVKKQLPGWIAEYVQNMERFGPAFAAIRQFFNEHKTKA